MTLRLYNTDISNLLLEKEYPDVLPASDGGIQEYTTHLELPIGKGCYREIYFEGVHIGFGDAILSNNLMLYFESDFETVEMHFALKGKSTAITEHFKKEVSFDSHQHNIIYANQLHGKMKWESDVFQLFEINLAPSFFKRYLPEDTLLFDRFRNAIEKGYSETINVENNRISRQMYEIIDDIMNCQRKNVFKRMFLEAKVIELLLLQFEQLSEVAHIHVSLRKEDIHKVYAVREFIMNNLNNACSLIELAHHVGTNEFTLKKGFKELFGTTVFGFWTDAKMNQAKLMITEQDMSIGEVSDSIGYKNPRHFSAAFKRKFGVIPSQFKK